MNGKLLKKSMQFTAFILILVCTVFSYMLYGILRLPDQLYVAVGSESSLEPGALVACSFMPESVAAMNQKDMPLTETLNTAETGRTSMALSFLGLPVKKIDVAVVPDTYVVPCGKTVGVRINAKGLMVLGIGSVTSIDGKVSRPCEGKVKAGDVILSANGHELSDSDDLTAIVAKSSGEVEIMVSREGAVFTEKIKPTADEKGERKVGLWLRSGTTGIGTMTYYNPMTKKFGALGHGILDIDTRKLIDVKNGKLMESTITSVTKGEKGSPGELEGIIDERELLGDIRLNTSLGLYGFVNASSSKLPAQSESMKIGLQSEVHEGPAQILSNVSGTDVKRYDVYIESVNHYSGDQSKGMVIRITDKELLTKTNGIVQGMSGSPIIQDGKLIGAVTHVFVQNPAKGYGIFIENMLKQEEGI